MKDPLDLEAIERSAYRSYFEDGMWDLFFGTMFIVSSIRTFSDEPWTTLLIMLAILVPILGKRYVTVPRLGEVRFAEHRERGRLRMMTIIAVAVIVSVAIMVVSSSTDWFEGRLLGDLVFGGLTIVVTAAMGHYLEYPLLVVHGIIFAVIMFISGQYGNDAGAIAYLVGGAISLSIGLFNLVGFLKHNPTLPMEG